jgi:hypothetical protein
METRFVIRDTNGSRLLVFVGSDGARIVDWNFERMPLHRVEIRLSKQEASQIGLALLSETLTESATTADPLDELFPERET